MDVFDANLVLPKDPNEAWPKRDPAKEEFPKPDALKFDLKFDPLKPAPL
jgi:hypothetical protein